MKTIAGYICLANTNELGTTIEIPFGKKTDPTLRRQCFENIATNRLVLFDSKNQAKRAIKHILKRPNINKVEIAKLKLEIAETGQELENHPFCDSQSLIVIFFGDSLLLIGRSVEGKPHLYPLPGAPLYFNGFQPIESLESAKYICSEYIRQGQYTATIATFELIRLS